MNPGNMRKPVAACSLLLCLILSSCGGASNQLQDTMGQSSEPQFQEEAVQEDIVQADASLDIVTDSSDLAFPLGMEISNGSFTGTVYMMPMIAEDDIYHFPATNILSLNREREAAGTAMAVCSFWSPAASGTIRRRASLRRSFGKVI